MEGKGTTRTDEGGSPQEAVASRDTPSRSSVDSRLDIIYTNADSFVNKRGALEGLLQTLVKKPAAIIITEVNPKTNGDGLLESEFSINGYNLHSINIGSPGKRGILIYIDSCFKSSEVNFISDFSEYVIVKITFNSSTLHLGAFYRSPSSDIENDGKLLSLLDTISKSTRENILLIGDFNYKNIDWLNHASNNHSSTSEKKFVNNLQDNLLTQHVTFATRAMGTDDAPSTLDLVITNNVLRYLTSNVDI